MYIYIYIYINISCGKFPRRDPTGNLKSWSHIFKFLYITQLSYKRKLHNSRASAINIYERVVMATPAFGGDLGAGVFFLV